MVLRRSESTKTTFSLFIVRKTKYQRWLGMVNVLVLLGSLSIIFLGIYLKLSYYMDALDHLNKFFALFPLSLIGLGVATFVVSSVGFIFSTSESRPLVFTYAVLILGCSVFQLTTVFFSNEVRTDISSDFFQRNLNVNLSLYNNKEEGRAYRAKWDLLQSRLRCCGASSFTDFSTKYDTNSLYPCFPNSCCWEYPKDNCSTPFVSNNCQIVRSDIYDKIYINGCFRILERLYEDDLVDLCLIYAVGGTFLALIEMVGVALAFAYAAQLHRRLKREREHWSPGEDLSKPAIDNLDMNDLNDIHQN